MSVPDQADLEKPYCAAGNLGQGQSAHCTNCFPKHHTMALRQAAASLLGQQPALLCVSNALRRCFSSSPDEKFTVEVCVVWCDPRAGPAGQSSLACPPSQQQQRQIHRAAHQVPMGRAHKCCCVSGCVQVLPAKAHRIEAPKNVVETSVSELLHLYELMYRMRRMEIAADMMYKAKLIRGFCHL